MQTEQLAERWTALRSTTPDLRTRDAAQWLGVSEAELVATMVGETAVRLDTDTASLLHALPEVGRCVALTRNAHAASEICGRYGGIELGPHTGRVGGDGIDLWVVRGAWRHAFAIDDPQQPATDRRSIHIFDGAGAAVHEIYLAPDGDARTWDAIVAARTRDVPLVLEPAPLPRIERSDASVEIEPFLAGWDALTDSHDFSALLAKHNVTRTQALRLAGDPRARRVTNDALTSVLHDASETGERIVIFVGNRGCTQAYAGAVNRIVKHGPWLNVFDPALKLYLREDKIASSWVVAKPTRAGVVRSLELFDRDGETIALVFRMRDDRDTPEDPAWHALLDRLRAFRAPRREAR